MTKTPLELDRLKWERAEFQADLEQAYRIIAELRARIDELDVQITKAELSVPSGEIRGIVAAIGARA